MTFPPHHLIPSAGSPTTLVSWGALSPHHLSFLCPFPRMLFGYSLSARGVIDSSATLSLLSFILSFPLLDGVPSRVSRLLHSQTPYKKSSPSSQEPSEERRFIVLVSYLFIVLNLSFNGSNNITKFGRSVLYRLTKQPIAMFIKL